MGIWIELEVIACGPRDAMVALEKGLSLWTPEAMAGVAERGEWIQRPESPRDGHVEFRIGVKNWSPLGSIIDLSRRYPSLHIDADEASYPNDETWYRWACLSGGDQYADGSRTDWRRHLRHDHEPFTSYPVMGPKTKS